MMKELVLKELDLDNGLQVVITDQSKKLVGDRYQVILHAEMEIPVNQTVLGGQSELPVDIKTLQTVLGEAVHFRQKREKTFIDQKEKDVLLAAMIDSFVVDMVPYLSRPDFPAKVALKEYKTKMKKRNLPQPE